MSTTTDFTARYTQQMEDAEQMHAPMFDAVQAAIGLRPVIEQTGGMTMTMMLALDQHEGTRPGYLGLVEGVNADGTWQGSLSYYPDLDDESDDEGTVLALAYEQSSYATHPSLRPEAFAQVLIQHYQEMNR